MPRMYCSHVAYCTTLDVQTLTTSRLPKRSWQSEVELIVSIQPLLLFSLGLTVANAPYVLQPCGLLYYPWCSNSHHQSSSQEILAVRGGADFINTASSSSFCRAPVANAPDVLQPCGLLYYSWCSNSHHQSSPQEILVVRGGAKPYSF